MKRSLIALICSVIMVSFAQAEAPAGEQQPVEKEKSMRQIYEELHKGIAMTSFAIARQEGALRSGRFGAGITGSFTSRFDWNDWHMTALEDGFICLDLNLWFFEFGNLSVSGGYHADSSRTVLPFSGMVQLIFPTLDEFEKTPSMAGIQAGVQIYSSSLSEESVTCLKLGFCHYSFVTAHTAMISEFNWITPSFRDNNLEVKFGFKYYFF